MFAASSALWDLSLHRRGRSLSKHVTQFAAEKIAINGLLDDGAPELMAVQADKLVSQGRTSIKMKLGVGLPERDLERVKAVADVSPEITLRLDVNGAWSGDTLRRMLRKLPIQRVEFIEQPLTTGKAPQSLEICSHFGCRLGLDEEIDGVDMAERVLDRQGCDVIILKPIMIGGLHSCLHLAKRAADAGIEVIYTSSWESDVGIAATLHLAAALGPHPPAMGLSTAGMISEGIVKTPLKIENGFLKVPEGPGLGIELAPELLAQLT
jgi:o-succinylbenzoate synthase